jgi:hypothetical protein
MPKNAKQSKKRKTLWIKPWLASRETAGAFHKLLKDLVNEPDDYKNYLRIELPTFEELVMSLEGCLEKKETQMRKAISPPEELAVILRFLAILANGTPAFSTNSGSVNQHSLL